jgi:hypothetical protein
MAPAARATFVGEGLMSCLRTECASCAPSVLRGCRKGTTARFLGRRQPKRGGNRQTAASTEITPASETDSSRPLAQPRPSGEPAAARSQERAAADLQAPSYLAFALAAAAVMADGSAKAITASPSSKLLPGSPPKP